MKKKQLYVILIIITLFSVSTAIFQNYSKFQSSSLVSQTESIPKTSSYSSGGYLMDTEADFNWEEINTTGTLMGISSQSNGVENISFSEGGWNFTFYETEYNIIYVRSDGWMTFPEFNSMGFWPIPFLQSFDYDFVALLMSAFYGLNPSIGGDIYYEFLTAPNRLIIEYSQIYDDSSQLVGDFQVIFYENGTIKFQYKNLFDVLSQPPTIGLDHGDTLNYNSYIADLPLISKAIQFTFDEMIYANYRFEVKENDEYEYILTKLNNAKLESYYGLNWEQIFSLPLNPYKTDKIKFKIASISENTTDLEINYDIWGWQNRFNDFPISYDHSESLSYKKEPSDYTQKHNLTNIIPMFLLNQTLLYLTRANISYYYSFHTGPPLSLYYSEGKEINGHNIYLNIHGLYNIDGSLTNFYIRWRNQTSNEEELVFNMEPLTPLFLEQSSLKVQSGDEHQWLLTELNETLIESIFGANWEGEFGLPENPTINNKIKIKIESTSDNLTHWNADYSLWDWTERDLNFDISPIEADSMNYLKDAFNYSMPHNYSTIFPFIIPKPVNLYLSHSNLDESFYSIPQVYFPAYLYIFFDVGEYHGHGLAFYSVDGYLTDFKLTLSSMMGSEITIFRLTHFNTGETPSNVIIKPGNEFNYDIFEYSENSPPGYSSLGMFKKANITVDYVSGDDYYLNRTIVISNYSLMDTMGTWHTNYSLQDTFKVPVDELMYIYQDAKDYLINMIFSSFSGFPFMVTTDMNWTAFAAKYRTFIPPGYNINVTAFSNGYKISQQSYYDDVEMIFNFTSYGVLESLSMQYNGEEFYLVQLNYSSIEAETMDPIITINSPSLNDFYGTGVPYMNITIEEDYLDEVWYTLDGGLNNITYTENQFIEQALWNSQINGTVLIQFYAKDFAGNIGYAEVLVYKDISAPTIIINSPFQDQVFSDTTPNFNLTISEANLDSMWYTIDNGLTNITIVTLIDNIDETEWNTLPNGQVTIRFYANDTLGNLGTALIVVIKDVFQQTPPGISGFNPILILLITTIGMLGISWRIKKK